MKNYIKENTHLGELEIYKILSMPEVQSYNKDFSTLILPKAVYIDKKSRTLTLPYYEGKVFNDIWTTENGGALMNLDLAITTPILLKDLAHIDTKYVTNSLLTAKNPKLIFNHDKAEPYFSSIARKIHKLGYISKGELARVIEMLSVKQTTPMIINNGDFYPRNFIKRKDEKIVLIDWETWNKNSPFFIIDHPENVAAVLYVHMWGNKEWQLLYLEELNKHFSLSNESLDKAIIIKALTMIEFLSHHKELLQGQIAIIKDTV